MAYGQPSGFGASFGYTLTPWVKRLLIANTVVFLVLIAVPALAVWLAFVPRDILVRPWTLVTYMFVHAGFFHLFFNMLILFFFGPPLESMWGSRDFLKFYLIAGLGAALISMFFAPRSAIVGASGAIYGVMLAFAMNWPNMAIYIWGILPVKAKWLIAFLTAASVLALVGGARDGVAHWAHLGGFITAFVYLKFHDRLTSQVDSLRTLVSRRRKMGVEEGGGRGGRAAGPATRGGRPRRDEDRMLDEVDRVLDKISTSGLQSLTEDELRLLDDVSKRYRQN